MTPLPFVIIGSGPAGVSAAWPLVEKGHEVLMLDAGLQTSPAVATRRPDLSQLRQGYPNAWRELLHDDLSALKRMEGQSPKLRTGAGRFSVPAFFEQNCIHTENFRSTGVLANGGLSNLWGAVASTFTPDEFDTQGAPFTQMQESYKRVAARIGISGVRDDDMAEILGDDYPIQPPLPLSTTATAILNAYGKDKRCKPQDYDFRLGRVRNAVLSKDSGQRLGCYQCKACMWGCPGSAIYNSAQEIPALLRHANFRFQGSTLVQKIVRVENNFEISFTTDDGETAQTIMAHRVILAAGALASTKIALEALNRFDQEIPLQTTPCVSLAYCNPGRLGKPMDSQGFGMAQLAFLHSTGGATGHDAFGLLYDADSVSAVDILTQSPLTFHGSRELVRLLLPSMMLGLVYFPGSFSANTVRLMRSRAGAASLIIRGDVTKTFKRGAEKTIRQVSRALRKCGVWRMPFSVSYLEPGADNHNGGTLPMGKTTSPTGELLDLPGLYIVDGAALPNLPAKQLTFTIMANADRIGRHIATTQIG
jgi:choline dehydrogenase-like flavoprotein